MASIEQAAPSPAPLDRAGYRARTWVTRSGIKVDRMASVWLIRRFIDPQAVFRLVPGKDHQAGPGELRFDMAEGEFGHEGELCTFEVLVRRFGLDEDPALRAIAEIVHDLDVKDAPRGRAEAAGVGRIVAGILAAHPDDAARMTRSAALLDDLHAGLGAAAQR